MTQPNSAMMDIHMQVMWNRLISVVEEQALTLVRTAFSAPACARPATFPPASSTAKAGCWRRR